jgi:heterotetrameric sarcosine oxidase delta subunit
MSEFRYGGEVHERPDTQAVSPAEWAGYVYMRDNRLGPHREWWYHRSGCKLWFVAERHTKTQEILKTYLWIPE